MTEEEPTGDHWRTLHDLTGVVRETMEKVERDSELNEKRIRASVRKMRWYRVAGVVGCVLAPLALWAGWRANEAVDQMRAQRAQSRVTTCESYNTDLVANVNLLNDRTQQLLVNAAAGGDRTPEQQARTDQFVAQERAEYERIKLKPRDCSPAGLERFYSGK